MKEAGSNNPHIIDEGSIRFHVAFPGIMDTITVDDMTSGRIEKDSSNPSSNVTLQLVIDVLEHDKRVANGIVYLCYSDGQKSYPGSLPFNLPNGQKLTLENMPGNKTLVVSAEHMQPLK